MLNKGKYAYKITNKTLGLVYNRLKYPYVLTQQTMSFQLRISWNLVVLEFLQFLQILQL